MNTKHTPGPWTAIITTDGTYEVTTNDDIYPQTVARMYSTGKLMQSQAPGNARLIAAAPELVEALIGVLDLLDRKCVSRLWDEVKAARDALAKAGA